jgi:hypothetical protein
MLAFSGGAPDGWWALRFELDSSEKPGSVSLVGPPSRTPKGHNASRWALR